MFGKLLKYDFKALLKTHIGMYIFLLVTGTLIMIAELVNKANPGNVFSSIFKPVLTVLYVIGIIVVITATFIFCMLRYRKNVLKDEGYLTHTLPVTSLQIHLSKLVVSAIYLYITLIVIYLVTSLAFLDIGWGADIYNQANSSLAAEGLNNFMGWMIVIVILSPVTSYGSIFASLCMGYKMSGNKDVWSFVMYILFYAANQVLSFILLVIAGSFQYGNVFTAAIYAASSEIPLTFVKTIMVGAIAISLVMAVIYNIISVWVLDKKLNLE